MRLCVINLCKDSFLLKRAQNLSFCFSIRCEFDSRPNHALVIPAWLAPENASVNEKPRG